MVAPTELLHNGKHGLINVETEVRSPLAAAVLLAGEVANGMQNDLFSPYQNIYQWDFRVIDDIVHLNTAPLDKWEDVMGARDHDFLARATYARQLARTGDLDRAEAVARLEKLQMYQRSAGDWRGGYVSWAESIMLRTLLGRNKGLQDYVLKHTGEQIEQIESGQLPRYVETFRHALTMKYFIDFRSIVQGKRADAERIVQDNPHLFGGAALANEASFSGLYAWLITGAEIADKTDYQHAQSGAFTRAMWGGKMVHYRDSLHHTVLSALGHSMGVGLLQRSDLDVVGDALIPVIQGVKKDKQDSSRKKQFILRFSSVIDAMRKFYQGVDDQLSLKAGNGAREAILYPGASRGDLLLEADQILVVLENSQKREAVLNALRQQGTQIAPTIDASTVMKMHASRSTAVQLSHAYSQLDELGRVVVLSALPNELYAQVNWQSVLNGQLANPTSMASRLVRAVDEVTDAPPIVVNGRGARRTGTHKQVKP